MSTKNSKQSEITKVTYNIPRNLLYELKMYALKNGKTTTNVILEAIKKQIKWNEEDVK